MTKELRKSSYPWPFFAAMAASLLLFFCIQALFPTLPLHIAAIGGTPVDNGLATWAFALAALLARAPAGLLADRWGYKPLLVLGALLFGSGAPLYALAPNVPSLLVIRTIHGVGMAFFTTTYQAFAADLSPSGRYGEGLGLANVSPAAAMVVAPLVGEWLAHQVGIRTLFLILGVVGGAGAAITLTLPGRRRDGNSRPRSEQAGQGGLRQALRQPGVRTGTIGMMLLALPFGAFIGFLPLLAVARGLGATGQVFAVYALAASLVQPLAGRIADRWESGRVAAVGLAVAAIAVVGLAVAFGPWVLLGFSALFGIGGGAAQAGLGALVQKSAGPTMRGSAAAAQFAAFDLVIGFGSLGLGWLAGTAGYGVMYGVAGGVALVGLVGWLVGWLVG